MTSFDIFLACLDKVGVKYQTGQIETADGAKRKVVGLAHGNVELVGTADGQIILLVATIAFDDDTVAAMEGLPSHLHQRLVSVVKREGLEGRTGFRAVFHDEERAILKGLEISQQLYIADDSATSIQRILDGMQEIAIVMHRCGSVLRWIPEALAHSEATKQEVERGLI